MTIRELWGRLAAWARRGNGAGVKEAGRSAWGFPALDTVLRDLRYAARGLFRSPGFSVTVVLTLALGIGANATVFAVIDRLMFRPFRHLRDPDRVNRVYLRSIGRERERTSSTIPYTRYLDLVRNTRVFSQVAAMSERRFAVGLGQETRVRKVVGVSASFFDSFDLTPEQGRFFGAAEDVTPRGAMVAVLSHEYWMLGFSGKPVLDRPIRIGSVDYTIIGVAPEGFVGTVQGRSAPSLKSIPTSAVLNSTARAGSPPGGDFWPPRNGSRGSKRPPG